MRNVSGKLHLMGHDAGSVQCSAGYVYFNYFLLFLTAGIIIAVI